MKMMIINGRSLPEKHIHTVNNNHTVRLLSEKEIVLPHSTGGSSRRADLHNHDLMIFQHSTFIHSELTYFFILKSETIIIAMISQCQTCYMGGPKLITQHFIWNFFISNIFHKNLKMLQILHWKWIQHFYLKTLQNILWETDFFTGRDKHVRQHLTS